MDKQGFTLIELLVSIAIIGILAAIALPAFLNQANKARMAEAKTTVGAINRSQQAYRINHPVFADSFSELGIGLPTVTENYSYTISTNQGDEAIVLTQSGNLLLKNFSGGVFFTNQVTRSAICQTRQSGQSAVAPALIDGSPACTGEMEAMQ